MAIISGQTSGGVSKTVLVDSIGRIIHSDSAGGVTTNTFGTTSVASGATTIIVTYTVPVNKIFTLCGIIVGGNEQAVFDLNIDGSPLVRIRNSGSDRTKTQPICAEEELAAGVVISINATNNGKFTRDFEGTIFGKLSDV